MGFFTPENKRKYIDYSDKELLAKYKAICQKLVVNISYPELDIYEELLEEIYVRGIEPPGTLKR